MLSNKIVVTGGSGLVGKYLKSRLPEAVYLSSSDYDLTKEHEVIKMYKDINPNTVIHLAARVGGILDNIARPESYFSENILMNTLMVKHARLFGIKKFTAILSTCIYPDISDSYPLVEDQLHSGPPADSNLSYAIAKRAMATHIDATNKQYGTTYNCITPCNLYGTSDKDNEQSSHFVTALLKKIHEANTNGDNGIKLFGTGKPLRQFMHADDLAKLIVMFNDSNIIGNYNVSTEENLSIDQIAQVALDATDSKHLKISYDKTMPDGQFRKDVSIDKLKSAFPHFKTTSLYDGLKQVYSEQYS